MTEKDTAEWDLMRREDFAARELWRIRSDLYARVEAWYPEDVFVPAQKGKPHTTVDAAAAAMARHVLRLIAAELGERSIELTHDEVHVDHPEETP